MKSLGDRGEELAAAFLKRSGLKILKRNYTSPTGEIDIIARDGDMVVFVEVKTRTDDQFGPPEQPQKASPERCGGKAPQCSLDWAERNY